MTCPIEDVRRHPRPLERGRYDYLHPDGRALIRGWRDRAGEGRADESFESLIYLWIAFNSWAACVTGSDADHEWQRGLIADPTLNDLFDEQVTCRDPASSDVTSARSAAPSQRA